MPGGLEILGEDGRGGAVARPQVLERRVPAGALGVMVDHDVGLGHAQRRRVAEHARLHVHQREAVELVELGGRDRAHLDAERLHHGHVLGPRDGAERDQRRGGRAPPEERAQGEARRDAVGVGVGLEQDAHLLARGEQLLELHHAVQVAEVRELAVHVVADLRPKAGPAQARVLRQLLLLEAVGHHEDRRAGRRVRHGRDGAAHEARVVRDQRELVAFLRVELRDGLGADAALERAEARRPRSGLVLERHPGELFALGRTDPRPQARQLGPITDDDATAHDSFTGGGI